MSDTKRKILETALELFARDGYEAVSVSAIAGALGLTKGALYRHYRDKQDIFDSILAEMERRDAAAAARFSMPREGETAAVTRVSVAAFAAEMFRYWTADPFAGAFRRMLTVEQFRSARMAALYQQYLSGGPFAYTAELLGDRGTAAALCGGMLLYYSLYDAAPEAEKPAVTAEAVRFITSAAMAEKGSAK